MADKYRQCPDTGLRLLFNILKGRPSKMNTFHCWPIQYIGFMEFLLLSLNAISLLLLSHKIWFNSLILNLLAKCKQEVTTHSVIAPRHGSIYPKPKIYGHSFDTFRIKFPRNDKTKQLNYSVDKSMALSLYLVFLETNLNAFWSIATNKFNRYHSRPWPSSIFNCNWKPPPEITRCLCPYDFFMLWSCIFI